jgi:hypothetical protein
MSDNLVAVTPQTEIYEKILGAKKVGTPIIAVTTTDPAACLGGIFNAIREFKALNDCLIIQWDLVRGIQPLGKRKEDGGISAMKLADLFVKTKVDQHDTTDPSVALAFFNKLPPDSVVFFHNAHRYVQDIVISQAIWNLRDTFKQDGRTLILLAPSFQVPSELANDVLVFDEPLPNHAQLEVILRRELQSAKDAYKKTFPMPSDKDIESACRALQGLNTFSAEQVIALSTSSKGLDMDTLWIRKKQLIEATPGLSVVDRAIETFDSIGGLNNIKSFMTKMIKGNSPPQAIVFCDEIEKMMGSKHDTSGVSQGFLGSLLTYMQDHNATGVILVSPPGCGKSAIAKAAGKAAGVPTIMLDLNGMKGSLVGESEGNLRRALKTITAVSQDNAFFIATCNSFANLPPELRRRFTFGTFFFDLPDEAERAVIWNIYIQHFGLNPKQEIPNSDGWSGANIRDCCHAAYRLNCGLMAARDYIVPISASAAEEIEMLRSQANGRFISASNAGVYRYNSPNAPVVTDPAAEKTGRKYGFMQE